ncbi:hypothetical protein L6R29_23905 [Myxococcota bacterium]|nr:hypothetical protein [Myxococcota bacterium]
MTPYWRNEHCFSNQQRSRLKQREHGFFWQPRHVAACLFLFLGVLMLPFTANAQSIPSLLLFVGNSYTYGNDPQALNQQTIAMLREFLPPQTTTHQERIAYGGYLWEQHLADLQNTQTIKPLRQLLLESQDPLHRWQWVVFQEQSQIPGIPETDPYAQRSTAAIQQLAATVHTRNARSILLMTWGRRDGDSQNKTLFPDFKTMQARLRDGYLRYRTRASTPQYTVYIAPAGIAWEHLYDDIKRNGQDPLRPESLWYRLYDADGSHPSLLGTFLAAATLTAALTGRDPRSLTYNPSPNILEAERKQLLQAAYQAVFQNTLPFPFPWASASEPNQEPTPESPHESEPTQTNTEPASPDASIESTTSETPHESEPTQTNTETPHESASSESSIESPLESVHSEISTESSTEQPPQDALPSDTNSTPNAQGCCAAHPTASLDLPTLLLLLFGLIFFLRRFAYGV